MRGRLMLWNDVVMAFLIFQKNSQKVEFCKKTISGIN